MREFLADRWIDVDYEKLVVDLDGETDRVISELGIPCDNKTRDYLSTTEDKVVNSPTQADVRRPVYTNRIGRWKNYERWLAF